MKRPTRLRQLSNDEAGFSLVFVSIGLLGFLGVSMLAVDVGMLMTARNQASPAELDARATQHSDLAPPRELLL